MKGNRGFNTKFTSSPNERSERSISNYKRSEFLVIQSHRLLNFGISGKKSSNGSITPMSADLGIGFFIKMRRIHGGR